TEENGFQDPGMNSFNHYAYGAIGAWLYEQVAGIDVGEPGYKQIRMFPTPGEGLTWVKASLDSVHGKIESHWRLEEGKFTWEVTVPPNTSAVAGLPVPEGTRITESGQPVTGDYRNGRLLLNLKPGRYKFE
ncbi:MAG TPA: alpha-L-rhamnosidase C-terminal domain-containing protein, partial [Fimbriimonas sp.]|nr:alpha-L-rhamnosidase C-terminal domain-containing protein [Fimbriimonas sp.]